MPGGVLADTVKVAVDDPEPGAAIGFGEKDTPTPAGGTADNVTAELNPPRPDVEIVDVPDAPCWIERLDGDAVMVKSPVVKPLTPKERLLEELPKFVSVNIPLE